VDQKTRISTYFEACGQGSAADIAAHFTDGAVIYDSNLAPAKGADVIASLWIKVRERWGGARWHVDSIVSEADRAAIEWSMTGTNPADGRSFVFRGSEHYRFEGSLITEIRQYWTFDPDKLDTALIEYDYNHESAIGSHSEEP